MKIKFMKSLLIVSVFPSVNFPFIFLLSFIKESQDWTQVIRLAKQEFLLTEPSHCLVSFIYFTLLCIWVCVSVIITWSMCKSWGNFVVANSPFALLRFWGWNSNQASETDLIFLQWRHTTLPRTHILILPKYFIS